MGVWDKTTPSGSDNFRDGDDRIRELKTALEEALQTDGKFPGAAPATAPIYRPRGGKDTTVNRPTAAEGGLFYDTTLGTFLRSDGTNYENMIGLSSGNTAARPANPLAGTIYLNTQTGLIDRYTGSLWEEVGVIARSGVPAPNIYLDNGATNGGAIYFDAAGASSLISSADGANLVLGGAFGAFLPASGVDITVGSTASRFQALYLKTNIGTATPAPNTLFADLIPKAWAFTNGAGAIQSSVNLTCVRNSAGDYSYSFKTALADGNFAVACNANGLVTIATISNKSTGGFKVQMFNTAGTLTDSSHNVMVQGTQ